ANDPRYIDRLKSVGSTELVRAWLDGDWTIVQGAFFTEWDPKRHVIRPFAIPDGWTKFRSLDWGSAAPFSVGWWAVMQATSSTTAGPFRETPSSIIENGTACSRASPMSASS